MLVSRGGRAVARPWLRDVVVAFGEGELPDRGDFALSLASGLELRGFAVGGGEVVRLEGALHGRRQKLPPWALLFLSRDLASVSGGPADPETWDRWFGELSSPAAGGEGEQRARAHRARALPPRLAQLYAEVRRLRESGHASRERLLAIRSEAAAFEDDWLLRSEVDELLPPGAEEAAPGP